MDEQQVNDLLRSDFTQDESTPPETVNSRPVTVDEIKLLGAFSSQLEQFVADRESGKVVDPNLAALDLLNIVQAHNFKSANKNSRDKVNLFKALEMKLTELLPDDENRESLAVTMTQPLFNWLEQIWNEPQVNLAPGVYLFSEQNEPIKVISSEGWERLKALPPLAIASGQVYLVRDGEFTQIKPDWIYWIDHERCDRIMSDIQWKELQKIIIAWEKKFNIYVAQAQDLPHRVYQLTKAMNDKYRRQYTFTKSLAEDVVSYLRAIALCLETVGNAPTHRAKSERVKGLLEQIASAVKNIRDWHRCNIDSRYGTFPDLFETDFPVRDYLKQIHELKAEVKRLKGEEDSQEENEPADIFGSEF